MKERHWAAQSGMGGLGHRHDAAWCGDLDPVNFHTPCPFCNGQGCGHCHSTGLHPQAASVLCLGLRLPELLSLTVDQLAVSINEASFPSTAGRLRSEIERRLEALKKVGLGYVSLDHGFITYFARFDLALILYLCARIGVSSDDPRLTNLLVFIQSLQGPYGLWEYHPTPQASRWLTFEILCSLSFLDETGSWLNLEPRTPFKGYLKKPNRF